MQSKHKKEILIQPSHQMIEKIGKDIIKYRSFDDFCFSKKCSYQKDDGEWAVNVYPESDIEKYQNQVVENYCVLLEDKMIFEQYAKMYNYDETGAKYYRKEFCPRDFWSIMLKKYRFRK